MIEALAFKYGTYFHPTIAAVLNYTGCQLFDKGNLIDAASKHQQALDTYEKVYRTRQDDDVAFTLYCLACVYMEMGRVREAKDMFTESFKIYGSPTRKPQTTVEYKYLLYPKWVKGFKKLSSTVHYLQQIHETFEDGGLF